MVVYLLFSVSILNLWLLPIEMEYMYTIIRVCRIYSLQYKEN
ncbi:hypothetical protein HMPREF3032_01246 [Veillonella sp. DNF00869]|nr:hypothetical protein HMPREF3032_01246 [Veillonella sp. DNF00869]